MVGRLLTLEDAGAYITQLPKADQQLDEWQIAIEARWLVVKQNGPTMFARIGVMKALNRHVERVFNSKAQRYPLGQTETQGGSMTEFTLAEIWIASLRSQ